MSYSEKKGDFFQNFLGLDVAPICSEYWISNSVIFGENRCNFERMENFRKKSGKSLRIPQKIKKWGNLRKFLWNSEKYFHQGYDQHASTYMYILEYRLIMSTKSSVKSLFYFRDNDIVIFEFKHFISKVTRRLTFY